MMKFKELQAMKPADIRKKEEEIVMELIKLQAQVAIGTTPKSPGQIRVLKRTLAQIKTLKPMEKQEKDARN